MRNDATQQFSPTQLGKSLVTGYEHLGIELARPQFRSKMEQDMKDIALGRQNKHQVISTCLHFVLQILCMCPHTAIHVCAYCYVFVLMLLKHQVVSTWMAIMTPVLKTCAEKSRQIIGQMERFFQVQIRN